MNSLSLVERQNFVSKCLKISLPQKEQYAHIHSDYHFWLMTIQYWYSTCNLKPVYLYGIIISLIKSIYLVNDETFQSEDIDPLSLSVNDKRNYTQIEPKIRRIIYSKFKKMTKKVYEQRKFDCSIIYEFNCLQTIYVYAMKVNEFFNRPFDYQMHANQFLCGSFFYAFVEHYETKQNLTDAIADLFQKETKFLEIINNLFMTITGDIRF